MVPEWFWVLSVASLALAGVVSAGVAVDVARRRQPMWIMNVVWPITALYGGPAALWFYLRHGRAARHADDGHDHGHGDETPYRVAVAKGAAHCGAGCTLGDLLAESLVAVSPGVAVWFGWQTIFAEKIFAVWVLDFVLAFGFGVMFQYFTIKPMRGLGFADGLVAAVKADALSLTAWQVGMYGFMAVANFWLFRQVFDAELSAASPAFWFLMQIAMWCGFATSYPMNWWLIRRGIKERM